MLNVKMIWFSRGLGALPPLLLLANHLRHLTKSTMLAFKGQKTMDLTHHSPSFPRWGLYLLCLARSGDWSRPHILCLAKPGLESRLPNSYPRALGPAVLCLVAQSCNSLRPLGALQDPLPMGVFQARILEWVAMPSSRGSSQPRSPALQADSLLSEPCYHPSDRRLGLLDSCFVLSWGQLPARLLAQFFGVRKGMEEQRPAAGEERGRGFQADWSRIPQCRLRRNGFLMSTREMRGWSGTMRHEGRADGGFWVFPSPTAFWMLSTQGVLHSTSPGQWEVQTWDSQGWEVLWSWTVPHPRGSPGLAASGQDALLGMQTALEKMSPPLAASA